MFSSFSVSNPLLLNNFVYLNLTSRGRSHKKDLDYLHKVAEDVIAKRRKQLSIKVSDLLLVEASKAILPKSFRSCLVITYGVNSASKVACFQFSTQNTCYFGSFERNSWLTLNNKQLQEFKKNIEICGHLSKATYAYIFLSFFSSQARQVLRSSAQILSAKLVRRQNEDGTFFSLSLFAAQIFRGSTFWQNVWRKKWRGAVGKLMSRRQIETLTPPE